MPETEPTGAPSQPVAQRIQAHSSSFDRLLLEQARERHPTVAWWWGIRPKDNRRQALCYVCDVVMIVWSGGAHAPTAVVTVIRAHRRHHIDQIMIEAATAKATE